MSDGALRSQSTADSHDGAAAASATGQGHDRSARSDWSDPAVAVRAWIEDIDAAVAELSVDLSSGALSIQSAAEVTTPAAATAQPVAETAIVSERDAQLADFCSSGRRALWWRCAALLVAVSDALSLLVLSQ